MNLLNTRTALAVGTLFVAVAVGVAMMPQAGQSRESAAALAALAPASGAAGNGEAWAQRCDDIKNGEETVGQYCEIYQRLSVMQKDADPATAQRLAEFAIGYPPGEKGKARGAMILPLGILVDKKVKIAIDDKDAMEFAIRYCDNGGCVGILDLNAALLDRLRKGKEMTVKTEAANGQDVNIGMSLQGFGAALEKVKPRA